MVYSDISHRFGALNLETTSAYHQHQHHAVMDSYNSQHQHHHSGASSAGDESPPPNSDAKSQDSSQQGQNPIVVPPEEAILELCERTKYQIIQENGQRRYGPPPDWQGTAPNRGCEVFIGKIPRDCFEDELVPIFEKAGRIYMFRLMMDFSGSNRGYGFCIYTNRDDTKRAVHILDNYEIRKGKTLGVCLSVDNCRLFVGGIPKSKAKHEILTEMKKITEGVRDVIVYPSAADKGKNRGFAFVEYEHHKAAAMARRKLIPGRIQLWGHQIAVDWAEPEREVDEDIMSKVKILYVRNLMLTTTEEYLRDLFTQAAGGGADSVERVKKIRDYAFVHFRERGDAISAMRKLDDTEIDGSRVEVSLAKPADKTGGAENGGRAKTGQPAAGVPLAGGQKTPSAAAAAVAAATAAAMAVGQSPALLYSMLGGAAHHPSAMDSLGLANSMAVAAAAQSGALSPGLMQPNQGALMRPDSPLRGQVYRGRMLRNAAGSRSAGARVTNIPGYLRDKKPNTELLDDLCSRNGLGAPSYQVQTHEMLDTVTGLKSNWFLGRVTILNLGNCGPRQYSAFRFTQTTEEARIAAAESALIQLSQPATAAAALPPVAMLGDPATHAFMAAQNFAAIPLAAAFQPPTQSPLSLPAPPQPPPQQQPQPQPQHQQQHQHQQHQSQTPTSVASSMATGFPADAYPFLYAPGAAGIDPNAAAFFAAAAAAAAAAASNPGTQHQHQHLPTHHQAAPFGMNPAAALSAMLSGSEIYAHYVN